MAVTRTRLIALVALVAIGGTAAFFLTSGEKPIIEIAASDNVIKIEAAGVNFAGWPEMRVSVNGEQIAQLMIEKKQRDMYSFDVPNALGEVKKIEIRMTNETDCRESLRHSFQSCIDRALVLRKVFLNDTQLEAGEASGEGNTQYSLTRSEGGATWQIGG